MAPDPARARGVRRPGARRQAGFSLVEALVAMTIATIAVVGLAYNFGTGRALVNRYETARIALGAAQRRLEMLGVLQSSDPDLSIATHGPFDVQLDGRTICQETWTVEGYDDPINGTGQIDLKRVTEHVTWGGQSVAETIELTRLFPAF